MKILNAVKTEERAIEFINEYLSINNIPFGRIESSSCNCECGETKSAIYAHEGIVLEVAICNSCGHDDAFTDEVLNFN